jgi:predicted transcriptional regulator
MVRRRGREDITMDILMATLAPIKKMRIMYKANLNYVRFNKYFNEFLRKGFIDKTCDSEGWPCYVISQRGTTLLSVLKKADELALYDKV